MRHLPLNLSSQASHQKVMNVTYNASSVGPTDLLTSLPIFTCITISHIYLHPFTSSYFFDCIFIIIILLPIFISIHIYFYLYFFMFFRSLLVLSFSNIQYIYISLYRLDCHVHPPPLGSSVGPALGLAHIPPCVWAPLMSGIGWIPYGGKSSLLLWESVSLTLHGGAYFRPHCGIPALPGILCR